MSASLVTAWPKRFSDLAARHCLGVGCVCLELATFKIQLHRLPDDVHQSIDHNHSLLAIPNSARMASLPTAMRSSPKIARKALQQRSISDVAITRTGKPILRVQGGRSVLLEMPREGRRLTIYGTDHHLVVRTLDDCHHWLGHCLIVNYRTHGYGLRCNRTAWTIHCEQIGYAGSFPPRRMKNGGR